MSGLSSFRAFLFLVSFLSLSFFSLSALPPSSPTPLTNTPTIGILTQPLVDGSDKEILVASYVKWVESAGARAVPIRYTSSVTEQLSLLSSVNGLLFPGGLVSIQNSTFASTAHNLLSLSLSFNKKGVYFPVWGTCLGFEQILTYMSDAPLSRDVLSHTDAEDIYRSLSLSPEAEESLMIRYMPRGVRNTLETENVTINMHEWGVLPSTFHASPSLSSSFIPIATSTDRSLSLSFLSAVEHKDFPIFGVQYHPEKNNYVFSQNHPSFTHTQEAAMASQFMANLFVNASRYNNHKFESEEREREALIYQWNPTFTGVDGHVEQLYYF